MAVIEEAFGQSREGQDILLYTLCNENGMKVCVTNQGAALVKLIVPDAAGNLQDVVLGMDTPEGYLQDGNCLGVVVGPNANRIANASFLLNGQTFLLEANDHGNNLHSHSHKGYQKQVWQASAAEDSVTFLMQDIDGNMGFPGNKTIRVTYFLGKENDLHIRYYATSDCDTILNLTNHSYFNLDGHGEGSIEEHELWLGASRFTPVAAGAIPTGEIAAVSGTPMDFTKVKKIGLEINEPFEQLLITGGYDHNWVIDGWDGSLRHFATVRGPRSGRVMKVFTTLPGVQFYTGNAITPESGKEGALYDRRSGLCLETQYFPDTIHHKEFPSCVFGGGREYKAETVYRFE